MTADTFSTDGVGLMLMGIGNDNNTWGSNQNGNIFQILADAIVNSLTNTVTGGTLDLSGSPPPAASSQTRYAGLIFNGALGSAQSIKVPNLNKWWLVQNATSGAFALTFKTPTGSAGTAIPQNSGWQIIQCDGSNNIVVWPFNTQQIQMPDGTVSAPAFSNINETNSGWWRAGTQDWRLSINGSNVLQVTGAGAGTASIVNVLSPNVLQVGGSQVIPAGTELAYAGIELPSGGWLWEDGTAYSRTTYATLRDAISKTCTGNTHSNTTLDGLSVDLRGKGLVGAFIEGTGILTGTTITAIGSAVSLTLSQAAVSTNSGLSIRILPWGQGDGSTTFNVPDRRERTLFGRSDMNGTSSPGRITSYNLTKINLAVGAENLTIAQANLPSYTLPNSLGLSLTATAGLGVLGSTTTGNNPTPIGSNGAGLPLSENLPVVFTVASVTGSVTSGGSNQALAKIDPGGVTNYIVKT